MKSEETQSIYMNLNDEEKVILIQLFHDMYYNTDQDIEDFAKEYYGVVGAILSGDVPTSLEYLVDFEQALIDEVPKLERIFVLEGGDY